VFAYGKTQADADRAADAIVKLIESHEDDFDGRSSRPTKACAMRWSWRRTASKPIIIADTQDNPGAGGDSDTTACCARWSATSAQRAATGVIYDPESARPRMPRASAQP
jgi:microcystin degradation protein MlrC